MQSTQYQLPRTQPSPSLLESQGITVNKIDRLNKPVNKILPNDRLAHLNSVFN